MAVPSVTEADVIAQALARAQADLPPEGVTIEAGPIEQMREELLGVLVDDAEHHGHAA